MAWPTIEDMTIGKLDLPGSMADDETFEEWVHMSHAEWRAKRNCQLEHDHYGGKLCVPSWITLGED